jgi:hypothetical protein
VFYVYEHLRQDTGAVFYVGKGSGARCKTPQGRNKWWHGIAKKHGYTIRIRVRSESEELAFLAEMELIDQHRKMGVTLVNMTDGGEGMSGHIFAPDVIARRAEAQRGQKRPGVSDKLKGRAKSPEHRLALSLVRTGSKASDEARLKISIALKGRPSTMLGKRHTEESKRKTSEALKGDKNPFFGKTHTPESLAKIIAANIGRVETSETRARKSASAKLRTYRHVPTQDQIDRQRATLMARPKVTCPHCQKTLDESNAKRWHFDNCKMKGG